jgi:ParB family chromosome partitioning protein
MGKLDDLERHGMANIRESIQVCVTLPAVPLAPPIAASVRYDGVTRAKTVSLIPVGSIVPDPDQPREEFDPEALQRLADSLTRHGQLQPIAVRWDAAMDRFIIVYGERRWRAAMLAGLVTISAKVFDRVIGPDDRLMMQLIENSCREESKPIKQAKAYRSLMDVNGWSAAQVARELSIDKARIIRAVALLDLPDEVRDHVESGRISPATAYEITKAKPEEQADLARRVVEEGLRRDDVADEIKGRPARLRPVEYKLPGGVRIAIYLADPEPERVIAALVAASKQLKEGRGRSATPASCNP